METYEEWDMTIPPIPPRSRLYRLEPIGIGTPYVESLTSYIARLAAEHCITPKNLIMREIIPLLPRTPIPSSPYQANTFWNGSVLMLNGINSIIRDWVKILQSLTFSENLIFLTMATFEEVLANSRVLRRGKAWCSMCYEEWRLAHKTIYEPLLWSLKSIDICLCHRQPLIIQCPYCHKTIPFLNQTSRPGYCSRCSQWLGSMQKVFMIDILGTTEVTAYQCWASESSGNLLAAAPDLVTYTSKKQVEMNIRVLLDHYADGNISQLARLSGVSVTFLWGYLYWGRAPYFDFFLKFCFNLSITPIEFLTKLSLAPLENTNFNIESIPTVSRGKRKPVKEDDVRRMRKVLENVLGIGTEGTSIPYMKDIAQRMGFDEETVNKHCPDLTKAIKQCHKKLWSEEKHRMVMKLALEKALESSEPQPLTSIARQLGCTTKPIRKHFPNLCDAITKRYRERINLALVEQRLQEALISTVETPGVAKIARDMGYSLYLIKGNFPELCKQVSTRRNTERKRRREEHTKEVCSEIRRIVVLLHEKGIYPSASQVSKVLNNWHILRQKKEREAWYLALEELGYSMEKIKRYD